MGLSSVVFINTDTDMDTDMDTKIRFLARNITNFLSKLNNVHCMACEVSTEQKC